MQSNVNKTEFHFQKWYILTELSKDRVNNEGHGELLIKEETQGLYLQIKMSWYILVQHQEVPAEVPKEIFASQVQIQYFRWQILLLNETHWNSLSGDLIFTWFQS